MSPLSEYQIGICFPASDEKFNISAREIQLTEKSFLLTIYDLMNDY